MCLYRGLIQMLVFNIALLPILRSAVRDKVQPLFEESGAETSFSGLLGARLRVNVENWELHVLESNPALIEMFRDRDRKPDRQLLPWSGEFIGKYLCASISSYRILRDPRQKELIQKVVTSFIATQAADGYLGPFDANTRLTGRNWDIWGHYWAIRGLLEYYKEFHSLEALSAATKAADLLVSRFMNSNIHLTNDGSFGQMNYAVIHAFTSLYRITGKPEYLQMAQWITKEWDIAGAGLYLRYALAGKEMFEFPGNRWESLHDFLGMSDMYLLTGDTRYRDAFTHIWYSILKGDRHNTGGFTSGERTTGDPYNTGAIETCCTVAWIDMTIAMLKLTGNSLAADELELATFNGLLGAQAPSGRWWTYNTPMDGTKEASFHSITFQCRPGSPELNCCSVNGPRGLALVNEWSLLRFSEGLALNYLGPSTFRVLTPGKQEISLQQDTTYPTDGKIRIRISIANPESFVLKVRIPSWSRQTQATVNGIEIKNVAAGSYLDIKRRWSGEDEVVIDLDMSPHFWCGERELDGRTSIYRGPILLAFDPVWNSIDSDRIPQMDAHNVRLQVVQGNRSIEPWLLVGANAADGQKLMLCDFATAGAYGNAYKTWLPISGLSSLPFNRSRPVWNNRP